MATFTHQWFSDINQIDVHEWTRLFGNEPFTRHAFLYAPLRKQRDRLAASALSGL